MKFCGFLGVFALAFGLMACAEPARQPTPVAAPAPAPAPAPPPGVSDLMGAQTPDTAVLTSRGFRQVRTRGTTQFWWRDSDQLCVRAVASRGNYRVIQQAQVAECGAV
jgi:hypothetical protein